VDDKGDTPLQIAVNSERPEVEALLRESGGRLR